MTDISYRSGSSTIAAHIWYNNYDRELPGPVTTVQQDFGELQKDRSVRSVIRYTFASKRFMSEITAGQSYEINLYNNKTYSTEGDNRSAIYLLKANLVFKPGQEIEVILNTGDEYQIARSLGYSEKQWRNVMSASLTTVYHPGTRLKLMLQGRQMFVTGTTLRPELTAAGTFLLTGNGKHIIKANISRNSEIPCLNDLYWVPGGNISLMPETSIGEEAGYSFVSLDPSGRRNTIDISLYRSKVDNLIQWIPGENGIWSAQNIRTVNTSGLESRFGTVIPLKNGSLKADLTYALTRTVSTKSEVPNDRSVGKQLIYTPLNHLNMSVSARRKFIRAGFATLFESRRFTSSDDSEWLPPSFIADANIGTVLKVRKSIFSFILKVNNVFNTPYESVSNYPMPLRTYTIKLNITFTNKSKIDEKHF
jgi:vitamin B12 transporter